MYTKLRINQLLFYLVILNVSCKDPRTEFNNGMKTWIGKPVQEYIQANGSPKTVKKVPR